MRAPLGVALVAGLAACAVEETPAVETAVSYIRSGTPAAVGQFPQVVALVLDGGRGGLCTGTLVAPDIVLTAAHCVDPATLGYADPAEVTAATTVVLDDVDLQAAPPGRAIAAADTRAMPGFEVPGDPDVGLVFLAEPVTDRPVAALNHDPAAVAAGTPVELVGFGETEAGTFGRLLHAGKEAVACRGYDVPDDEFLCLDQQTGAGICSGDSGGPAFATIDGAPRVVGITSFGDQDCTVLGAHMRVDAAVTRAFLDEHAPELLCRVDGACDAACPAGIDPDCDEVPADDGLAEADDDLADEDDAAAVDDAVAVDDDAAAGCAAGGGAGGPGAVAALALAVALTGSRRRSPSRR